MTKQKIVTVIMGQNCEKFIGMALESVKDSDAVVYCDGGSADGTLDKIFCLEGFISGCVKDKVNKEYKGISVIENKYDQEDKGMNGKQRNFYLDFVKENYPGWWCLCIDADEVVEDFSKIRYFINNLPKDQHNVLWSIKMRHFISDLGHEDATQPVHFVQHRLFKIRDELFYPEVEHPILAHKGNQQMANIQPTTIWHLAYIPNLWDYKKKYKNHLKKSDIHTKEYLDKWYKAHLFGQYPKKQIIPMDIPAVILKEFGIDKDELYFMNRGLETKHFIMSKQWVRNFVTTSVLDVGCGLGHCGYTINEFLGCEYTGIDKSKWAIKNTPYKNLNLIEGDITEGFALPKSDYDLVLLVDVLEHLEKEKLDFVLKNISKVGKHFIFSIPYIGMPDLDADPTHKIKESKEWWIEKLGEYFTISDAPKDWLYSEQIFVGEKK